MKFEFPEAWRKLLGQTNHFHILFESVPTVLRAYQLHYRVTPYQNGPRIEICDGQNGKGHFAINNYFREFGVPIRLREFSQERFALTKKILFELPRPLRTDEATFDYLLMLNGYSRRKLITEFGEKIMINRREKAGRTLHPEDTQFLKGLGYIEIFLEDFSIAQQASIFGQAKSIVAVHGAGLANIVFCTPGTHVLELNTGWNPTCYHNVAANLEKQLQLHLNFQTAFERSMNSQQIRQGTAEWNTHQPSEKTVYKLPSGDLVKFKSLTPEKAQEMKQISSANFNLREQKLSIGQASGDPLTNP